MYGVLERCTSLVSNHLSYITLTKQALTVCTVVLDFTYCTALLQTVFFFKFTTEKVAAAAVNERRVLERITERVVVLCSV